MGRLCGPFSKQDQAESDGVFTSVMDMSSCARTIDTI
jgi:hypothetical protein